MKIVLESIMMLLAILLPVSGSFAGPAEGPAAGQAEKGYLTLDSCSIDLGTVKREEITERVMNFRNDGDAPLQILSIFSECGCTTPSYTTDPVDPGETGEIRILFNGTKRSPGPFRKALRIRSNAGNPRVVLFVNGVVE
ncbi:MAG: DUF1573 domain-containing protein [Muribaculaceae bacterium]|nr:DUF1573 domain-containing protein [Muribaculaceae bacterium]